MSKVNSIFAVAMVAIALGASAYCQNLITPVDKGMPPGTAITINNSPSSNQTDPHVSGDLASYTSVDGPTSNSNIHYFNFATAQDNTINNGGGIDFLSDVSGTQVVFSRSTPGTEGAIELFDTSNATLTEIDSSPGSARDSVAIGGPTIAWQDRTLDPSLSQIVVWNTTTSTATQITNDASLTNLSPDISPDGNVITWLKCNSGGSGCNVFDAVLASGVWTTHQLTTDGSVNTSVQAAPTNGSIVVYARGSSGGVSHIYWQPVTGGTESELSLSGSQVAPSLGGNLIAFAQRQSASDYQADMYVYDLSSNFLYQITNTPAATTLSDVSVNANGVAHVIWQTIAGGAWGVYGFSFTPLSPLPPADLAVYKVASPLIATGKNLVYVIAVVNRGPSDASNVALSDALPSGTTFVSAFSTQGTCANNSGTVNCSLGGLKAFSFSNPNGALVFLVVRVTAGAGSSITNTATVTASNPDPNQANNVSSATTAVVAGKDN
jgi:uncharacterized repeat protein (TIGR01451 family)